MRKDYFLLTENIPNLLVNNIILENVPWEIGSICC
jgi:hypothetical protein